MQCYLPVQGGVKELKREALLNLPQAPIPQLSAIQSPGLPVAASKGGSMQPPQPPHSDHPAALHQPTVEGDADDFGAFQASSSFPVQKEPAATGEHPHLLQPVQLQKPLLPPGLSATPPTGAGSIHAPVTVPSSSTDWTTSGPQGTHTPKQLLGKADDSAQVAASTVPIIPSEAGQISDDRYAVFRDLSANLVDANTPVVQSTSKTEGGELLGVSPYVVEEHKEQTAEATGLFSEVCHIIHIITDCVCAYTLHMVLYTALWHESIHLSWV